ncbi:HemK methyltransferase family member 1 [Armadillidium nasatum]|uniref:peptide chain release factor N(5)-glutamine methyltransferase n=1 Tax=Armadillidium nasatum TaxID=96803 RepID=A0A5N5T9J6_9CRUS|nr:HemK methyltransferase family member 1 [Armadillidium nasatum]
MKLQNLITNIFKHRLNSMSYLEPIIFKRKIQTNILKPKNFMYTSHNIIFDNIDFNYLKNQLRSIDTKAASKDEMADLFTSDSPLSIRQVLTICEKQLKKEEIFEADLSSEYIISRALNIERLIIVSTISYLFNRMPIQYILGDWDFHSFKLKLRPPVFIPRPETEELVNIAISVIRNVLKVESPVILDVCCGSGAISLAMLNLLPNSTCVAIDKSKYAVDLTIENAKDLDLCDRLHVIHGKITDAAFPHLPFDKFDLIVSNPPYIPQKNIPNLQPEILLYEDMGAIFGGVEGLDVIKNIILQGQHLLKENGRMIMEVRNIC